MIFYFGINTSYCGRTGPQPEGATRAVEIGKFTNYTRCTLAGGPSQTMETLETCWQTFGGRPSMISNLSCFLSGTPAIQKKEHED